MSLYKIQLENGELYKSSKVGRVQHYKSQEKAEAKIKKLGDIALNAIVIENKARTVAVKTENPEEIVPDPKIPKVRKTKKSPAKPENPDETATDAIVIKPKKTKKNKNT